MDTKEMREKLADVVDTVPRSNEDMQALYAEKFGDVVVESDDTVVESKPLSIVKKDNIYTYIGAGETPPNIIKFMGIQVFSRGQATEVTDKRILAKIAGNASFVKGEVEAETLYDNDEKAKAKADAQREEDVKIQIEVERQNKG